MSEEIHECRVERGTGRRCGLFIIIVTGCALTILAAAPPETDGLTKGVVWRQGFEGPDPSLVDWWGNIEKTVELQEIKTEDGRTVEHLVIRYNVAKSGQNYWSVRDFAPLTLEGDRKLSVLARVKSNHPVAIKGNIRFEGGKSGIIDSGWTKGTGQFETLRIEDLHGRAIRTAANMVKVGVLPEGSEKIPVKLEMLGFAFGAPGETAEVFVDDILLYDEALFSTDEDVGALPFRVGWAARTDRAPVVDGLLDEEGWKRAPALDDFTILDKGRAEMQTVGRVLYDDSALTIAVDCQDVPGRKPEANVKFRDGSMWEEDSIEIFLIPPESSVLARYPAGSRYFQFGINALGTRYDGVGYDGSWDADWSAAVTMQEGSWQAEIRFPYSELGLTSSPKGVWILNLCRTRSTSTPGRPEHSAWSPVEIGFHDVSHFGRIVVGEEKYSLAMVRALVLREDLRASLELVALAMKKARNWIEPLPQNTPQKPGLLEKLAHIDLRVEGIASEITDADDKGLKALAASLPPRIAALQDKMDKAVFQGQILAFARDMPRDGHLLVLTGPAITNERFTPGRSFPQSFRAAKVLSASACAGETESLTFVLYAFGPVQDIRVEASDLTGEKAVIPSRSVDLRVVKYWYQAGRELSRHMEKPTGPLLVPELLLKDDSLIVVDREAKRNFMRTPQGLVDISDPKADLSGLAPRDRKELQPFDLQAGELKQIWVNIKVPVGTAVGSYRGSITVKPPNAPQIHLPLTLEVYPFTLLPPVIEYSIFYRGVLSRDGLPHISTRKVQQLSEEQYLAQMKNLLDHGVVSATSYQSRAPLFRREMELRARAGLPKGSIYTYNPATNREQSKEELDRLQAEIRPWVQYARDEGYSELYIFAHPDEPGVEEAKAEVASAKAARAVGAKLFTAIGPGIYEEVARVIDLSKILDLFVVAGPPKAEMATAIHRGGGRIMCYANPQVGMEEPRTYRRNYGIVLWKAGYDGTMNYAYQHAFGHEWNDWDDPDGTTSGEGHRDHMFAYSTMDGVIDTVQWEGFREAVDDVRYISTLLAAIKKAKKKEKKKKLAMAAEKWLSELDVNDDLDAVRRQIARKIMELAP